jgi:hypothetical protein
MALDINKVVRQLRNGGRTSGPRLRAAYRNVRRIRCLYRAIHCRKVAFTRKTSLREANGTSITPLNAAACRKFSIFYGVGKNALQRFASLKV